MLYILHSLHVLAEGIHLDGAVVDGGGAAGGLLVPLQQHQEQDRPTVKGGTPGTISCHLFVSDKIVN